MISSVIYTGTVIAAVGCGLVAGLLFAFSVAIMNALGRLPAAQGMAAMRSINVVILNPLFLLVFMGTTLLCGWLVVAAVLNWSDPGAQWRLAGGLLYVIGVFGVTMVVNVPMNNRLDAADPDSADGQELWARYRTRWTAWNHLRTAAGVAATTALMLGLP